MKLVICAVRDRAADVFGTPFFSPSTGVAIRSFTDEVNNSREGNQLNRHPDDFELFYVGSYVDEDCSFVINEKPRSLALAKDLVRG